LISQRSEQLMQLTPFVGLIDVARLVMRTACAIKDETANGRTKIAVDLMHHGAPPFELI
jgi:hypothetical protein